MQTPTHFYTSTLLKRGWNQRLIASLLGPPDKLADNPFYKCAAPARLYEHQRVFTAEASPDFQSHLAKRSHRSSAAQKAVQTKTERLQARINQLRITIPQLPEDRLIARAIAHYNRHQAARAAESDYRYDTTPVHHLPPFTIADAFRDRLVVNYLRRALSSYDHILHKLHGQTGQSLAHQMLFQRLMEAIQTTYPMLANECHEQIKRRFSGTLFA